MAKDPAKLNIAICNDRESDRMLLKEGIFKFFDEAGRERPGIATFSSAASMLDRMRMRKEPYDLIFLNIKLPQEDGYACAEEIRRIYYDPKIIYLGSSLAEAVDAMENLGIYFLKMPFHSKDVRKALHVYDRNLDLKRLKFHADGQDYSIIQENICYITKVHNDVTIWVKKEKNICFTFQKSMTDLIKELAPSFQRIRRNVILNYTHVKQLSVPDRCFIMDDGRVFDIPASSFSKQLMLYKSYMANIEARQEGKK
ncbi:MAG: response regulator [Eubacterium sp.]|nr:response regulator [Eubacterium sp.]